MRFFTSDLHVGHQNIITYCARPYRSVAAMDADLVARWNQTVSADDEVIVVGDLALGRLEESLEICSQLNGRKILIPGNHDRPWRGKKNGPSAAELYEAAGFEIVHVMHPFTLAGHRVEVNHFPFVTGQPRDSYDDKFAKFRPLSNGQWLLHGHVHDRWRQYDRMINVGADAFAGYPVAEHVLEQMINAGPARLEPLTWSHDHADGTLDGPVTHAQ